MANVLVRESSLEAIADAIREKLNVQTTYKPSEMADAIESIGGGGGSSLGTKSITANGTYNASSDSLDGYSQVTVNVPQGVTPAGTKQISITENGTTTEDVTNYANAEITVNVSGGSSTNYGKANVTNILEMLYALEHGTLATGEFTVSSYFPANTESVIFDTGLGETVRGIIICDEENAYTANTENMFMNFGCFYLPENPGDDQASMVASAFIRYRGSMATTFFGNRMNSWRLNGGKLYGNPKYAQANYTYFQKDHTYRWFAWPYPE